MTRSLTPILLPADPAVPLAAATKQYVDNKVYIKPFTVITVSSSTTITDVDIQQYIYLCTGSLTITLPTANGTRSMYTIKRTGPSNVTVAAVGGELIDGAATFLITTRYQSIDLVSIGATDWAII